MEFGQWDKQLHPKDEEIFQMPARIELTQARGWNDKPKARSAPGIEPPESFTGVAYYTTTPEGIELHWSVGTDVGIKLVLTGDLQQLRGVAEAGLGHQPPWKSAPVTLWRVECE